MILKNLLNKKHVRITIGVIFIFLFVMAVVPNIYLHSSSDGVVNAKTTTMTSPIEGVLNFVAPVKYGVFFKKGEEIGRVANDRVNKSFLFELKTEKKMLEKRIESFTERLARYMELSKSLEKNMENYRIYSVKNYEALIAEQEHNLNEEQAEFERAQKEHEANKLLIERGAIDKRLFEKTESNYIKSSRRILSLKSKIDEHRNLLEAVKSGTFLGEGHNDSPYSKQRMDQMVIEISLAKTAIDESKSRVSGIEEQIQAEEKRIKKAECFTIIAPWDSLVWRQPLIQGSTVVINSELIVLLDCSSVFLDIALSESQFANVAPGDKIKYRLIGNTGFHDGTVFALRGSGSQLGDNNLAAILNKDPQKEFRIWVNADSADMDLSPENFYQVGRRVEVKLPRKWKIANFIRGIFDVF